MIRDHLVQAIEDVTEIALVHYGPESARFHHADGPKIYLGHVYNFALLDSSGQQITKSFAIKICTDMIDGYVKYVCVWPEFEEGRTPISTIDVDADADLNGMVNWVIEQMDNAGFDTNMMAA